MKPSKDASPKLAPAPAAKSQPVQDLWEYLRAEIPIREADEKLRQIGSDGWEVVSYSESKQLSEACIFAKRRLW